MSPEKTTADKWDELLRLLIAGAISSAILGWLLSICASFFFPLFYLSFWKWWLIAVTFRALIGNGSND